MILSVKTELMKIKTEKTEFGKKQNGIWKKIKRISYGPTIGLSLGVSRSTEKCVIPDH